MKYAPEAIVMLIVISVLVVYLYHNYSKKEEFNAEKRAGEIHQSAKSLFQKNRPYSEYKSVLSGDAVEYTAMKELYKAGRFTPEHIKKELLDIDPAAS